MDLSDNLIAVVEGFPPFPRLKALYLGNNRITRLSPSVVTALPSLETLVLSGNRVQSIADLEVLGGFRHLVTLSLIDNPVCAIENYRSYLIHKVR